MRKRVSAFFLLLLLVLVPPRAHAAETGAESGPRGCDWGFPHGPGVVLVLSGGGTKGFSHIGVIEVLERENIPIAAVVGTSMGGIVGGLYASGYSTAELRQILEESDLMEIISGRGSDVPMLNPGFNRPPASGRLPISLSADSSKNLLGRSGVLKAKDLYTFLSGLTSRVSVTNFNQLPIPFATVATNLENGDTVILRDGNLASAMRATMSIPILFEPWEIDGKLLVDGGLKANLPVMEAKRLFPGHPVIAVNLSPEDISVPRERLNQIFEVSAQTLEILMVEQIRVNAAEADIVIAPDVSDFSILDSEGYDKIIARGAAAADARIGELRGFAEKHSASFAAHRTTAPVQPGELTVAEIHFNGVSKFVAEQLYEKFDDWVGKPLDMKKMADTVADLSAREEFLKVDSRITNITDETVAVVFTLERPPKYEISLGGYASNLHTDRWLGVTLTARDLFYDGDTMSYEYRFSKNWGNMLRYFSPLDRRDMQFGVTLSARKEEYSPKGFGEFNFERYSGKVAYYKDFGRGTRLGAGYAFERASFGADDDAEDGPYISFTYHNLDNSVLPTQGFAASTELWYPLGEDLVSRTMFQTFIPLFGEQRAIFSGGLKTGDGDRLPYAAVLGSQAELYSLARHPLVGDQAWWLHVGTGVTIMKSWWGGVGAEIFGNYGEVMRDWSKTDSWWEVGLGLSLSTGIMPGRFIVVYDRGGDFTFGYSIGVPNFWNGPLP